MHTTLPTSSLRLDYLDAVRAFALLVGIVFHAALSFLTVPVGWAVTDVSTSELVGLFVLVSHSFRMEVFFLIAGFFTHLSVGRSGTVPFLRSRLIRLGVPFVIGWFILRPLIVSRWVMGWASMAGEVDVLAGLLEGVRSFGNLPKGLFAESHLWFLYYLGLITVVAIIVRAGLSRMVPAAGRWIALLDRGLARAARAPWFLPILIAVTARVLWSMQGWGMDTPDKSLRPDVPVLLVYGGFFALGWMLDRNRESLEALTQMSVGKWVYAVAGLAGVWALARFQLDPGHPSVQHARIGFVIAYAALMWSLVLLMIGSFRHLFSERRAWVRYVADSSYWMYLIHLPIVVWMQVAVAEIPLHWSIKLVGISVATIAISLLSYDLFVRSTFVGAVLNGRRRERVFAFLRSK